MHPASSLPAASADDARPGLRVFAVARIGRQRLAIDSATVLRAMPLPDRLTAVPRRSGAIEGVFDCDGQALPVVRLERWLDLGLGQPASPAQAPTGDERLLVLREGTRRIGLRVDAVVGVRRAAAGELSRIHHDESDTELFQSVLTARTGEPETLAVLEVGRLMALVNAWCPEAPSASTASLAASATEAQAALARRGDALASFRIGDAVFAIRTADVHELIPFPPLERGLPPQSAARGLCRWRERIVPVVDLGPTLHAGTDPRDPPEPPWVCIVRQGELTIGLPVHQVLDLLAHDAATVAAEIDAEGPVAARIVGAQGGIVHVIDTGALMRHFPETLISAPREAAQAQRGRQAHSNRTFVVFDAGTPYASPVDRVSEILDADEALRARLQDGVPAVLEWRGQVVPIVDLRSRLAMSAQDVRGTPRQLLVIADGDRRVALAIERVRTIISAHTATSHRLANGPGGSFEIVSVDAPGHRASYQLLDLAQFLPAGVL